MGAAHDRLKLTCMILELLLIALAPCDVTSLAPWIQEVSGVSTELGEDLFFLQPPAFHTQCVPVHTHAHAHAHPFKTQRDAFYILSNSKYINEWGEGGMNCVD